MIDSAALFGSLRKKIVPHQARDMFKEIWALAEDFEWTIVPKWIESLGNVCDSATHTDEKGLPLPIDPAREKRTWEVAMSEEYLPPKGAKAKRVREDG